MGLRKKLFALFFLSGFCGLLYQIIWVRLAFAHFGVITPVLSVIVSVFMLGLAIGSWAAGKWVAPITAKFNISAAVLYSVCEFLIGLSAFAVPWLFAQGDTLLLPGGEMNSASYLGLSALVMTATVLPWCICMGATFPLMMAFIKEREPKDVEGFSFLYLANVIGAVTGTLLTANVLVELMGFRQTLLVAGLINFLIAGISLMMAGGPIKHKVETNAPVDMLGGKGNRATAAILFITGFTSMSSEVVWTRAFTPIIHTTIYSFALVLGIYLAATALGSYLYRRHLAKGTEISNAALAAGLAIASFLPLLLNDPRLHLRRAGVEISIFPICALLGYLTPKLIDHYARGDAFKTGHAYAVNVVGCVLGPLFASYVLLPQWGVKGSLILLAIPYALLLFAYSSRLAKTPRLVAGTLTVGLLLVSIGVSYSHEEKYPGGIVRRDHTATVICAGQGMDRHLYVNGMGITILNTVTKAMAHLPLAFHKGEAHTALTICFGMGTSYRSLLSWGLKTTAVELVPSVRESFGYFHADATEVLANPQGQIIVDDGRRYIKRTSDTFDVIVIDPPPPIEAAGSSLLYSTEMYELLKKRLTKGGILQQWFPGGEGVEAQAIARSLVTCFPYVKVYRSLINDGFHYLASMEPLEAPTLDQFMARLPAKAKKDLLEWETDNLSTVSQRILKGKLSLEGVMGNHPDRIITDDRPYNEYYYLRRSWARAKREGQVPSFLLEKP